MNVWLLQTGEPLPLNGEIRKMRTGLLADELLGRGHKVHWWVSAFEHQRKFMQFDRDQEITCSKNFILHVLKGTGYKENISLARYIDYRVVSRKFRQRSQLAEKPDVIVASLPCYHLAYEGVRYANDRNIPVLIDVRDLWPDIFIERFRLRLLRGVSKVVLYRDFWRVRHLLSACDGILAISQGVLDWALKKSGRSSGRWDKVFFTGYKNGGETSSAPPSWLSGKENRRLAVYVGTFGHSYELHLLARAARFLEAKHPGKTCFVLAGTGFQEPALRDEVSGLPNVVIPGWIGAEEIRDLLGRAWVGLVPCRSVVGALPNKMFEYLSAGLPVISSLEGEMAEAIDRYSLGINYLAGDLDGLCRALERLLQNPEEREQMARNALNYYHLVGDADPIYREYADHIERIYQDRKGLKGRSVNP